MDTQINQQKKESTKSKDKITSRQKKFLFCIFRYFLKYHNLPSGGDASNELNYKSKTSGRVFYDHLERKGYLKSHKSSTNGLVRSFTQKAIDLFYSENPKNPIIEVNVSQTKNLTFGQALEVLKSGGRIAREGWNGKGMFLFLLPAGNNIPVGVIHDPALREVIRSEVGKDTFDALGSIRMFTADKKILTGWLASQTDMLSEDWMIVNK